MVKPISVDKAVLIEVALVVVFLIAAVLSLSSWHFGASSDLPLSGDEYLGKAKEYMTEAKIADATLMSWYAKLQDPGLVEARYNIALTYYRNKWLDDAMSELDSIIEIKPGDLDSLLLKARIQGILGGIQESNRIYGEVLDVDPDNPEAHYYLGVNNQAADSELARKELRAAIRSDPHLAAHPLEDTPFGLRARLQLARLLFGNGEVDLAIEILEESYALAPTNSEIRTQLVDYLNTRAQIYQTGFRDYIKALEVYERIVEIEPEDIESWLRMGEINRYFLDDYEAALRAYEKAYAISRFPELLASIEEVKLQIAGEYEQEQ
jgi:tetratricopeptide (TPR) repeat protein